MTADESGPPPVVAGVRGFGRNSHQHRTVMRDIEPAPRSALDTQREVMWKYGVSGEINAFLGRVISPLLSLRFQKATPDNQPVKHLPERQDRVDPSAQSDRAPARQCRIIQTLEQQTGKNLASKPSGPKPYSTSQINYPRNFVAADISHPRSSFTRTTDSPG